MYNTRFNPSANGNLHLGHIYSLLINERFAHDSEGHFYIRFDDTSQAINIEMEYPEKVPAIIEAQKETIEWLGIKVDGWQKQSDILEEVHALMQPRYAILHDPYPHYLPISIRLGNTWTPYPYTPYQTAERVVMDRMLNITHVIRGEEFMTEYSLYRYFCDIFNYPYPQFICLPRLVSKCGDISKTNGGYTIAELRGNGYKAQEIISLLEHACLNWYHNGWSLYNLKSNPKIDL
jgi:glutamyl/glutaminyl-tRNA synthetase